MLKEDLVITTKEVKERDVTTTVYVLANIYSSSTEDFPAKVKLKEGQPITDEQAKHGLFSFDVTVFSPFNVVVHRHTYSLFASEISLPREVPVELQVIFLTSMNGERSITYIPNPTTWVLDAIRILCELRTIIMPSKQNPQDNLAKLVYLRNRKRSMRPPTDTLNIDAVQLFIEKSTQARATLKAELAEITITPPAADSAPATKAESLEQAKEQARIARQNILKQYNKLIYTGVSFLKPFRRWLHTEFLDSPNFLPLQMIVYRFLISKIVPEPEETLESQCFGALRTYVLSLNLKPDDSLVMESQLSGFILFVKLSAELATLYLNTSIVSDLISFSNDDFIRKSKPLEIALCICKPFTKAWLKLSKLHRRCGNISTSLTLISSCVQLLENYDHEQESLKQKVILEHKLILQQLAELAPSLFNLQRVTATQA